MTAPHRLSQALRRLEDRELVRRVAEGDLSALGELYDRHHAYVRRVLERVTMRSPDVDDLVQATFLAISKIAGSFDGGDSARAWLGGVAVRLAARRRRSLARFLRALTSFAAHGTDVGIGADPEAVASDRENMAVLDAALGLLNPKKRDAFVLVEVEGLAIRDVAVALGVPEATVRTRVFYARTSLRRALKGARQ